MAASSVIGRYWGGVGLKRHPRTLASFSIGSTLGCKSLFTLVIQFTWDPLACRKPEIRRIELVSGVRMPEALLSKLKSSD